MGNSNVKNTEVEKKPVDERKCKDGIGNQMTDGCEEIINTGQNVLDIAECKMECLDYWKVKLEKQRDLLKKNINNLERKFKKLSESTEKAISNSGF
tara:strand:+ start:2510 stop:2797 length:288 start_codon:yes stop_codon:yes gene_type:complete